MNHSPIRSSRSSLPPGLTKACAESPSGGSPSTIAIHIPALISHCHAAYWKQHQLPASEAWHTIMSSHYSISAPIRPSRKLILLAALLWGLPIVWGRRPGGSTCREHPLQGKAGPQRGEGQNQAASAALGARVRGVRGGSKEECKTLIFCLRPIPGGS